MIHSGPCQPLLFCDSVICTQDGHGAPREWLEARTPLRACCSAPVTTKGISDAPSNARFHVTSPVNLPAGSAGAGRGQRNSGRLCRRGTERLERCDAALQTGQRKGRKEKPRWHRWCWGMNCAVC